MQQLRRDPTCIQILKYCSHLSNHKWTAIKSHNHPWSDDKPVSSSEVTYFGSKLHKGSTSTWSTKQTEHTWSTACTILVHFQVMNNFISCTMHPHFLQISKRLQYSADSQCQISILNNTLQIASILPRLLLRPQISAQLTHNKDDRWSRLVKQPKWHLLDIHFSESTPILFLIYRHKGKDYTILLLLH